MPLLSLLKHAQASLASLARWTVPFVEISSFSASAYALLLALVQKTSARSSATAALHARMMAEPSVAWEEVRALEANVHAAAAEAESAHAKAAAAQKVALTAAEARIMEERKLSEILRQVGVDAGDYSLLDKERQREAAQLLSVEVEVHSKRAQVAIAKLILLAQR